jgi:short-subunit dehydrogenase
VVSGGGTGIGLAVTTVLAARGLHVSIIGRRRDVLERAAEQVNQRQSAEVVSTVVADLSESEITSPNSPIRSTSTRIPRLEIPSSLLTSIKGFDMLEMDLGIPK